MGYRPNAGTSANSHEEKVINALQGQLWIDKETFAILRCDGKTVEPVTVALIATVRFFTSQGGTNPGSPMEIANIAMTVGAVPEPPSWATVGIGVLRVAVAVGRRHNRTRA
jgi:hypothetical protein